MTDLKCFLSILFFCILLKSNSQTSFGLKAGLNFSTIQNYPSFENGAKTKVGIKIGLFTNIKLSKQFSFRPEALISQKGSKLESSTGSGEVSLRYFSIPLLLSYSINKNLSLDLGPGINFLLSSPSNGFNKFDLTANAGVRYSYAKFGIDLRYDYGFNKLVTVSYFDPITGQVNNDKMGSNRTLQLSFYYTLSDKK